MLNCINKGDFSSIALGLDIMKVLFKKYRYAFRSDRLFTEINFVVEKLKTQFLNLGRILVDTYGKSSTPQDKAGTLKFLAKYLDIFHSLNS